MSDAGAIVEHWGTFEVANFGDLLYPAVVEPYIAARGASTRLVGPFGGTAPMGAGRIVRRAVRHNEAGFWTQADVVDAIVLGGGDLIHAGDFLASAAGRAERVDAWSFSVESGLLATVRPFAWNGVGVPFDIPSEHAPLLREVCASIDLLSVRDERSRTRLEAAGVDRDIAVVPDTGALASDVISEPVRALAVEELRRSGRLPRAGVPTAVVHMSFARPGVIAELAGALDEVRSHHPHLEVVFLELGPAHGDALVHRAVADRLGGRVWLVEQPTLTQATAVLAAGDVIVSTSYHATLVGATFGVPTIAFFHDVYRPSKQTEVARSLGREAWLLDRPSAIAVALDAALRGDGAQDPAVVADLMTRARSHLSTMVDVVTSASRPLPNLAERDAAHRSLLARLAALMESAQRDREDLIQLDQHARVARQAARLWEAAYWRANDARSKLDRASAAVAADEQSPLLVSVLNSAELSDTPYRWGHVGPLFTEVDAVHLADTFPLDEAELRDGTDGRRSWRFHVRCLLPMGGMTPVRAHRLDPAWRRLADGITRSSYRDAMSRLTGFALDDLDIEANLFSYGPGAYQQPHPDLPEKVVTHVLWFNEKWEATNGGCLRILGSKDADDVVQELLPQLGWSAVFVRSANSWHSVTPVSDDAPSERRALVITFHRPGSTSSMWSDER